MNAKQEKDCYGYSITQSLGLFTQGEYRNSRIHLENAIRSLDELHAMQKQQEQLDEAREILQSINPTLDANAIVEKYKDSGYV